MFVLFGSSLNHLAILFSTSILLEFTLSKFNLEVTANGEQLGSMLISSKSPIYAYFDYCIGNPNIRDEQPRLESFMTNEIQN